MPVTGRGSAEIETRGSARMPAQRCRWWQIVFCLLVMGLGVTGVQGAEPRDKPDSEHENPAVQLAHDFVGALEEKARLTAESTFLQNETALLSRDRDHAGNERPIPLLDSLVALRPEIRKLALSFLEENTDPVHDQLAKLATDAEVRLGPLRESCLATRAELNAGEILLFDVAVRRQVAGQIASLINIDNRWLWLCGVLAVGMLLLVRLHHYRHYYRRLSWVRRKRATLAIAGLLGCLCLVLIPTLLTFLLGNRTYESIISLTQAGGSSPKARLEKEVAQLNSDLADLRQQHELRLKERDEALIKRKNRVTSALKTGAESKVALFDLTQVIRDQLRKLAVNSQVETALASELTRELPELDQITVQKEEQAAGIQSYQWIKRMTGAGLGLTLLACSVWAALMLEHRISKERRLLANTCPRCLAKGKLTPNPNQQASGGVVPPAIRELICTNVISEDPYEECEFTFLEQHRERERLTFPTLGVASSGKTVGMLMTYHQLRNGKCYGAGTFEKLSTAGSKEFDWKVDDLINKGIVPSRSAMDALPPPVVFNFCDSDPVGKSNALINIFDYAGMVTSHQKLTDAHRFRALNGDGYFFYLDPTYPSQEQSDALNHFREDIKTLRRLGPNQQVHTPVALCLSKIDLMVNQPYGQGDTILEFYEDLRKIEQSTENGSLERIVKRSELTSRLRHLIWPDWEIESQIRGLFGDRFLFFPMTPIGMDQPGEENFSQRDLRPYCILEPLSWLLHMNGYPILKE
jgi:hypothetical protein